MSVVTVYLIPTLNPPESLVALMSELRAVTADPIVVVNDGSGERYDAVFARLAQISHLEIVRHHSNLGKGAALKNGFNFILDKYPDAVGVVTMDADGQHLVKDAVALANAFKKDSQALYLGTRVFSNGIPWRSRFGNLLTAQVYRVFTGIALHDTQTGLRAIPKTLLPDIMQINKNGYDYEMEVLLYAPTFGVEIKTLPIDTVYLDQNKNSHFNPLLDSLKIYFTFIRFSLTSILSAVLDMLIFYLCFLGTRNYLLSLSVARVLVGSLNFAMNRQFVFKSKQKKSTQILSFAGLVFILGAISYCLMSFFILFLGFNVYWAKLCAEALCFALSFSFQRTFVFRKKASLN